MVDKYLEEIIEMLSKLKAAYESEENTVVVLDNTDIRNVCIALEYVLKDDEFMNYVEKKNCIREAAYIIHRANENEVGFARISVDLLETLVDIASSVVENKQNE